jgi:NodT family efflux transporter outer membrane factor (OMF) lipoprotein
MGADDKDMLMKRLDFNMRKRRWSAAVIAIIFLTGCAVGPDYRKPEIDMPGTYHDVQSASQNKTTDDLEALAKWWTRLDDSLLTRLIETAVTNNRDFKKAESRVKEARYRRRISRADLLPSFSTSGSASRSYSGKTERTQNSYQAGLDAAWELDLFGGTRRKIEAAQAEYEAAREDLRSVLVSLTAEVAINYVQLRTYQSRLVWVENNLQLQQETLDLTRLKFDTGLAPGIDVDRASYNLASTRAQIPSLKAGMDEVKNRLAVLLGEWPGDLSDELSAPAPIPASDQEIGTGIPADLLRRRPDIRRAERLLAAQTAQIGAAEAEAYPGFNLQGNLGYEALVLNGLISPANLAAGILSGVSMPIFRGGEIRANIKVQSTLQEQTLIDYENAVYEAVEEVENALYALAREHERIKHLEVAAGSARDAADVALQQYEAGLADFENVLETQRSLTSFQDQLAQSRGSATLNLVFLYKALGGGWTPDDSIG